MSCFGVGLSYVDEKVGVNVGGIFGVVGGGGVGRVSEG